MKLGMLNLSTTLSITFYHNLPKSTYNPLLNAFFVGIFRRRLFSIFWRPFSIRSEITITSPGEVSDKLKS